MVAVVVRQPVRPIRNVPVWLGNVVQRPVESLWNVANNDGVYVVEKKLGKHQSMVSRRHHCRGTLREHVRVVNQHAVRRQGGKRLYK